ncbi:MAG: hypothetical protein HZA02_07245 [Nitrospinae bacterium]|nr:hypothetical protein [Nitrospinota bacterium]
MKRIITLLVCMAYLILYAPGVWGLPYLVVEPAFQERVAWDVNPAGMLVSVYDLDHNGKADFYALRVVIASFYSERGLVSVARSYPNHPVFFVNYGDVNFYYVADVYPLFYAIDVNEDGIWDLMYKDASEDGVNGNEMFYESPSGMFTSNIAKF